MSMLKKAENQTAYGKVGLYGDAGSGKTFTASCIAIGLHKFAKCTKPIAFFDTEPALSYVLPLFKAAEIDVLCYESRSLSDLMKFMNEAEKECSIVIIDSITHIWRDVQKSYIDKLNETRKNQRKHPLQKLELQHWGAIKDVWAQFTDKYLSSKVHVILCGRMSSIYEYQLNDSTGKKELITNGTKMATEKELGYEPSLLIEMIKHRENGKLINRALIEKDRYNFLNGDEIDFTPHKGVDLNNIMNVFEKLKPHFHHLNLSGKHFDSLNQKDSQDLYPDLSENEWPSEQRERTILAEEIQGIIVKYYPGQTAAEKQCKADLLEKFFNTRSWTKISEKTNTKTLKEGYRLIREYLENKDNNEDLKNDVIITPLQLKDLELLINDDKLLIQYINDKYNLKNLKECTEPQYIAIKDELRIMKSKIEEPSLVEDSKFLNSKIA
jgi:hypothetical protein